tara:strand:+ start:247 stop:375 length:129 start_codon:yes stop_codon:yes gene_type:complete
MIFYWRDKKVDSVLGNQIDLDGYILMKWIIFGSNNLLNEANV